jgi:hypothetical protein
VAAYVVIHVAANSGVSVMPVAAYVVSIRQADVGDHG